MKQQKKGKNFLKRYLTNPPTSNLNYMKKENKQNKTYIETDKGIEELPKQSMEERFDEKFREDTDGSVHIRAEFGLECEVRNFITSEIHQAQKEARYKGDRAGFDRGAKTQKEIDNRIIQREKKLAQKELLKGMPQRPNNLEMLDKEKFKKQYPSRTGVEIDIENKRRENAYCCYLKDLEKWANDLETLKKSILKGVDR